MIYTVHTVNQIVRIVKKKKGVIQMSYVQKNYAYMLSKLGMSSYEIVDKIGLSKSTVDRLQSDKESRTSFQNKTINQLVEFYNSHGDKLYPHHIDYDTFKNKDIASLHLPTWSNEQVQGTYVCYYLSKRGTGKPKAMLLRIIENEKKELTAMAIDTIHDLEKVDEVLNTIFTDTDAEECRKRYDNYYSSNYDSLRGSRFLTGVVTGCDSLMSIFLKNKQKTHEIRIATSLITYLITYENATVKYKLRGGAAISLITHAGDWPYSMLIGMIRESYWHPAFMNEDEIKNALERIGDYQKKDTMLCLQQEIDALWYEIFMDAHRKSKKQTVKLNPQYTKEI